MRSWYHDRRYVSRSARLSLGADDCTLMITLLLMMAMAILTAPRSGAEACEKLHALLSVGAAPELTMAAGAIGEPVSPSP